MPNKVRRTPGHHPPRVGPRKRSSATNTAPPFAEPFSSSSQQPFMPGNPFHPMPSTVMPAAHQHQHQHQHHQHHDPSPPHDHSDADTDDRPPGQLPPALDIPTPQVGSTYPDFEALRNTINVWALRDHFLTRIHKKDQTRAIYQCRHFSQGCQWKLRANVNKDTGQLVVSSVVPEHTCSRELYDDADGKPKYAKRGVQYTQRWVKDALTRGGFTVTKDTEPRAIIDFVKSQFGEEITERLATKSKQSILEERGDAAPKPVNRRVANPSRATLAERERDMHVAMEESRHTDRLSREANELGTFDINGHDLNGDPLPTDQDRPFVFESGVRVIGPSNPKPPSMRQSTMPSTGLPDYMYNNGFPGPATTPSSATGVPGLSMSPALETRACTKCSGSGVVRVPSTHNGSSTAVGDDDDELALVQKQIALLSKQVTLMQRRRAAGTS